MYSLFNNQKPPATDLTVCVYGNPVLRRESAAITAITAEIRTLAEQMLATLPVADGIGLAAPQVGHSLALVVLDVPPPDQSEPGPTSPGELALLPRMPLVLVNPRLTNFSAEEDVASEGCLSLPGIEGTVQRPSFVDLTCGDLAGNESTYRCGGLLARCLQHEIDHLRGRLFIDHLSDEDRAAVKPTLTKLKRRGRKQAKA